MDWLYLDIIYAIFLVWLQFIAFLKCRHALIQLYTVIDVALSKRKALLQICQ